MLKAGEADGVSILLVVFAKTGTVEIVMHLIEPYAQQGRSWSSRG